MHLYFSSSPQRMMNPEKNLVGPSSYLFINLLLILQTSHAKINPRYCSPSSCGSIRNISFPFRLKDDPKHCGNPVYELECENNATTISYLINSQQQKYKVKAINYDNFTIRFADVSINNTCSVPTYSAYRSSFRGYPYDTVITEYNSSSGKYSSFDVARPINYMRCPYPLKNSSLFTEFPAHCGNGTRNTYIKVGHMNASELREMCRVDLIVMTSWKFKDLKKKKNVSISEIHASLLYGFELSWLPDSCSFCGGSRCYLNLGTYYECFEDGFLRRLLYKWVLFKEHFRLPYGVPRGRGLIPILVVIAVVLFSGISPPARIITGFFSILGIIVFIETYGVSKIEWIYQHFGLFVGLIFAARFIIIFPFVMGFLIYKFRRRHLSMFDAIESFLQSDNNLVPIRYSYSDIRKMTRGFREKLGEGGYGSVYKGKLRSGLNVAVKILGKSGADGKDFMNEIATIGRIHHVNVVNLVGYCAERSKRVLVFDFMPNGSLDKYIYSHEKRISLSWDMKYKIAIGVARGIEYLHTGCDIQILHFDIKPHNILLDDKFIPKITDFGLAKFCSTDKKVVTMTAIRGTIGYVAPELINRGFGGVSYKADVYSFGMMLIELLGLKRDLKGNNQTHSEYFPCWIYDRFDQGNDIEIEVIGEDNDDDNKDTNREIAKKMTIVALWCILMSPSDRPSMNKVMEMLEGQVECLRVPNRPSMSKVAGSVEDQSWSTYSSDCTSLLNHDAVPSIEITVED